MSLYDILLIFQWSCMILSGIISIRSIGNKNIPIYMENFYWYSFVAAVFSVFGFLHKYLFAVNKILVGVVQSSLLLFHFIFLSLFIYKVLPNKESWKYVKPLFPLFVLIILLSIFTNDITFIAIHSICFYKFWFSYFLLHLLSSAFRSNANIGFIKRAVFLDNQWYFFLYVFNDPSVFSKGISF
jgi:hypothetical protein